MDYITVDKVNEVYFRLNPSDFAINLELKEFFSCYAPNYYYHPKFKSRIWDGKVSFYNIKNRLLPIGLHSLFKKFLYQYEYKVKYNFDKSEMRENIDEKNLEEFYTHLFTGTNISPRNYQKEAVLSGLIKKRGIHEHCTGSGKSLIIYCLVRFLLAYNKQSIIIVPNTSLVEQMYSDFGEYGWKDVNQYCNKLYSKQNLNMDKPILITTWQSVYKRREQFFDRFSCVISDEAHHSKAYSIGNILKKCTNAEFRFGFSGTLPTEKSDLYNIFGFIGPKLSVVKSNDLIDRGILSRIKIANIVCKYPKSIVERVKNRPYQMEIDEILKYKDRNKVLDFIFDNTPADQNSLLLVNRVDKHLNVVVEYLKNKYPNRFMYVISGSVKPEERETIRKNMEKKSGVILCATYQTLSTGINIKRIHNIIFFASYKSKIKVLQSIGRGLRTHKTKNKMILFDVIDDLRWKKRKHKGKVGIGKNYSYIHWEERLKYYKEQGFKYLNKILEI